MSVIAGYLGCSLCVLIDTRSKLKNVHFGKFIGSHYPDSVVYSSPVMSGFLKTVPSPGNVTQCLGAGCSVPSSPQSHTEGPGCSELTSGVTHHRHPDTRRHPASEHPTSCYYHHNPVLGHLLIN